ncbi:hypothetical protein [Asticcacaulis sp.]|uniref:hypothetical protein n=1 Tax=Asticcacaulis sp. TaxID=1872648 RepID=UPI002C2D8A26|nr:hypothetical protein [Asticcacaulis sp.]HTM81322.1 hypothetical protein [Asticcacaulis sp.]
MLIPNGTAYVTCTSKYIRIVASDKTTLSRFKARLSMACRLTDLPFTSWECFWQNRTIDSLWRSGRYKATEAYDIYHALEKRAGAAPMTKKTFANMYRTFDIGTKKNTTLILKKNNTGWAKKLSVFKSHNKKTISQDNAYDICNQINRLVMSPEDYAQFLHDDRF